MLRIHCGWAGRWSIAIVFLVVFQCSIVCGGPIIGPLIGVPPLLPPVPPPPTAPTLSSISGYVYLDSALKGVRLPGEWGLPSVMLTISGYLPNDLNTIIFNSTTTTNSAGYYNFPNLQPGDVYTITESQPSGYQDTTPNNGNPPNTLGYFQGATGGTLTAPPGVNGIPSSGTQSAALPNEFYSILLPLPTGAFAPSKGVGYSAVNYNFGELPITPINNTPSVGSGIGKPPLTPSVPGSNVTTSGGTLTTSLAVVGGNNRFLAGAGTDSGILTMSGAVINSPPPKTTPVTWQITSLSTGLTLLPSSGNNLPPGSSTTLTGSVDGANLLPGTQNATFSVSGAYNGSGNHTAVSTGSAVINPVYSRGSDATSAMQVSPVDFGRVLQGGVVSSSFTVASNGSHDIYTDLTMNAGDTSGSDDNVFITGSVSSPFLFNGTTPTSPAVVASGVFISSVTGPISGSVTLPGDGGLFTGETLASGTPVLPSLSVPYTATVLEPRNLQPVAGGDTSTAVEVPTTGGGLLYGAVVPLPNSYTVTSTNANPDDEHATRVYVQGSPSGGTVASVSSVDGVSLVGVVAITQTSVISSGGTLPVALSVQADNFGPTSGSASLTVATAEDPSVGDTTDYSPLPMFYNISNVGFAATGGPDPAQPKKQLFGAPLSASFAPGAFLAPSPGGVPGGASLTSLASATGSSGSNSTTTGYDGSTLYYKEAVQQPLTAQDIVGAVGSRCDILSSDALSDSTTVDHGLARP